MAERTIKLPDIGEGIAEAELVEWHVKVGDLVREDAILGAVMTDKATVEVPSPAEGKVVWLAGEVGDTVAIGSDFVRLEIAGAQPSAAKVEAAPKAEAPPPKTQDAPTASLRREAAPPKPSNDARTVSDKPLAAPAVRLRAREADVDLRRVSGSGPAGRITHQDLDAFIAGPQKGMSTRVPNTQVKDIKITGLRRMIAEKVSAASSRIPHFTYVEEVDVTALEALREKLNAQSQDKPKLTLLPFLMLAMVRAVHEQPQFNARFDDEAGVLHQHGGVHIGIATQTPAGLAVPVMRHAETRGLRDCAAEVARVAEAARSGTATREDLTGSTITITSLGALGGVSTTPVINHPEVAIVGVNKIMTRPHWDGAAFVPRKMMNLSSSFDHRVIDGWDAAVFIQRIKALLETPALIFIED
jgi:2-oxoisovalerate dehydrogenase E2 component (dihydrolipoyl transacylase)